MRVRTDLWRLALISALGLAPGCGGKALDGNEEDGSAGSSGVAPWEDQYCHTFEFDAASGIVTCQSGLTHRAALGEGCAYDPAATPPAVECDGLVCDERPRGFCDGHSEATWCSYACLSDSDCASDEVCICGDPSFGGRCVRSECKSDADCADGKLCVRDSDGCFSSVFRCASDEDECSSNDECGPYSYCADDWDGTGKRCESGACGSIGRPFLVNGQHRVATLAASGAWRQGGIALPDISGLTATERAVLSAYYARIAQLEHASIAAFARFALQLLALGAPAELVEACHQAALDETAHAKLCFELASVYGGRSIGPAPLDIEGCFAAVTLREIVRLVIVEGCIGETVAALEAAEAAAWASDSAVRAVLTTVARDELRHAELAWRFVRWALEQGGDPVVKDVRAVFDEERGKLVRSPLAGDDHGESRSSLAAHGLLPAAVVAELRFRALRDVVLPCAKVMTADVTARRADHITCP